MPCNKRSKSSISTTSKKSRRSSSVSLSSERQSASITSGRNLRSSKKKWSATETIIQASKPKPIDTELLTRSRGEARNLNTSSNSSKSSLSQLVQQKKRAIALTDGTDHDNPKKIRFHSRSTEQPNHNLRSLRSSIKSFDTQKQVKTVTPLTVRKLNFSGSKSRNNSRRICKEVLPVGVVNIYPRTIDLSTKCNCPKHRYVIASLDDNAAELSSCHIFQYGAENVEYLREQEVKENNTMVAALPEGGILDKQSLSSISSGSGNSPPIEHESDCDDDSTDSKTYSSDEDDEDDDTSSLKSPRPGAHERFGLRTCSVPLLLHFSSLPSSKPLPRQPYITPKMRGVLVNWMTEVSVEYQISDDAYHMGVTILDAVLAKGPSPKHGPDSDEDDYDSDKENMEPKYFLVLRQNFQALGCACLWIASKIQDKKPPLAEDFVYIADSCFTVKELKNIEDKVCQVLEFRVQRVSPVQFLNHFLKASYACTSGFFCSFDHPVLRNMTMYILELSRLSYDLVAKKPSLVAAASLYLARATLGIREPDTKHRIGKEGFWTRTLEYYTGYGVAELEDAISLIHNYQLSAESSGKDSLNASFAKFKKIQYRGVSNKTVPNKECLGLLGDLDKKR